MHPHWPPPFLFYGRLTSKAKLTLDSPAYSWRVDMLKLKGYLTCFPQRIVLVPKQKDDPFKGLIHVDHVILISEA